LGSSLNYKLERNTDSYNNIIMSRRYILPNIKILLLILREREYLGDPGLDGRIIMRWIFRNWDLGVWTVSIWFRIETGGGYL